MHVEGDDEAAHRAGGRGLSTLVFKLHPGALGEPSEEFK